MQTPLYFVFYLFSLVILVHWWLIFKSADDVFDDEVANSGLDLIIGIIELIMLEYIVINSRTFNYIETGNFVLALLLVDLLWSTIWRYFGKWKTTNTQKIKAMEVELTKYIKTTLVGLGAFLFLQFLSQLITPLQYVTCFIVFYLIYIFLTFRYKIININIF